MTRPCSIIAADSTDYRKIPAWVSMAMGYRNGAEYPWPREAWDAFPGVDLLAIDVTGAEPMNSDILDVETGDATPADAHAWVSTRHAAGWTSRVYCNLSTWPAVKEACAGLPVMWWIANPDPGVPHAIDGASAVQFATADGCDLTLVTDWNWWIPGWVSVARKLTGALGQLLTG